MGAPFRGSESYELRRSAGTLRPAVLADFSRRSSPRRRWARPREGPVPLGSPLGVLRRGRVPLAGTPRRPRLAGAAASVVRILKTDAEGTFYLADATPGVYSVLAARTGFPSASAQVLHRTTANSLSFVASISTGTARESCRPGRVARSIRGLPGRSSAGTSCGTRLSPKVLPGLRRPRFRSRRRPPPLRTSLRALRPSHSEAPSPRFKDSRQRAAGPVPSPPST